MPTSVRYDYTPSPGPQAEAHKVSVDELLYGGAAGGGKSRFARAAAVIMAAMIPGSRVLILRRTFKDLRRSVEGPLLQEIPKELGSYNRSDHEFRFVNGSILELGYLQRASDLDQYQGAEYQLIIFEEATHFTEEQYEYLLSRLRAAGNVQASLDKFGIRPRMILTANPGGIGHHWVKRRFVDPAPAKTPFRLTPTLETPNPGVCMYLPARATDNKHLGKDYLDRLDNLPENLRAALRDGSWDILDGVRFPTFNRAVHVIDPSDFPIPPEGSVRALGVDYGSAAPFAGAWVAKVGEIFVVYREAYKAGLTPPQQAKMLRAKEGPEERDQGRITPLALDPSMWARSPHQPNAPSPGGLPPSGSIASSYREVFGGAVKKAHNDRLGGAALIEELLRVREEDGLPRLFIYSTCTNLIRTLPSLPRDDKNPDDVDTHAEDHIYDALRYALQELAGRPTPHGGSHRAPSPGRASLYGLRDKQF